MKRRSVPVPSDFVTRSAVEPVAPVTPPVVATPTPPAPPPSVDIAVAEVLGFPIRWLAALPVPSSLLCSFVADPGESVVLRTSGTAPSGGAGLTLSVPAFVGPEVAALALAAEHDRARAATLRGWLRRKAGTPAWRLTPREAIGTLGHAVEPLGWTTGRVLATLGLRLDEVWL